VTRKEVMKTLLETVSRERYGEQVFGDHADRKRVDKKEVSSVATWTGRRR
jgi:hypothetical protein